MKCLKNHADLHSSTWSGPALYLGLRSAIHTAPFEGNLRMMHEEIQRSNPRPHAFGRATLAPEAQLAPPFVITEDGSALLACQDEP